MRRASRGGQLSARQCHAIAQLLNGAANLQRIILSAAKAAGKNTQVLKPLIAAAKVN